MACDYCNLDWGYRMDWVEEGYIIRDSSGEVVKRVATTVHKEFKQPSIRFCPMCGEQLR